MRYTSDFLCGILYESWLRPLLIISLIPVSFIGVFLVFWFTEVPFGTGGFASLVLLCGIVVNSGIYILCEYDNLRRGKNITAQKNNSPLIRLYVRAYNRKIGAVMLTVVSTVAGLIPFLFDGQDAQFWYSFAVGTIAGLVFSLVALVLFMPVFLRSKPRKMPPTSVQQETSDTMECSIVK